jgi:hypothetical protein
MGVNMLDLRMTDYVRTPLGVGRILFFTDYKPIEINGSLVVRPMSAVVYFEDCSANKYPLDQLAIAEKPQIQPSEPIVETV